MKGLSYALVDMVHNWLVAADERMASHISITIGLPRGVTVSTVDNMIYSICDVSKHRTQCLKFNLAFNSFIPNIYSPLDRGGSRVFKKGGLLIHKRAFPRGVWGACPPEKNRPLYNWR